MASNDRFNISCSGCGTKVAVSMAHVGKKGRCPSCKTVFPITAPAANEPVMADLVPMGAADLQPILTPGLQPISTPGLQPLGSVGLQPIGQAAWQGGLPNPYGQTATSPFGQPASPFGQPASPFGQSAISNDELRLAPAVNPYAAPVPPSNYEPVPKTWEKPSAGDGELNGSLWGGIGMMVLAVVWFVGGLFFDIIFFYPPILFIIGLVAFVKGLVNLGSR